MSALLDRLHALRREGVAEAIDVALAEWVRTRDGRGDSAADGVALAACLASRAAGAGDVALDLAGVAGRAPWAEAADVVVPAIEPWVEMLRASPAVAVDPEGDVAPERSLVLRGTRLTLARFDAYETRIAAGLVSRAQAFAPIADVGAIDRTLARLFVEPVPTGAEAQRDAVRAAAGSRIVVISGGPGTGKTTTVVRILALLAMLADRPPRIRLAAPTGKGATRLGQAVGRGLDELREADIDRAVLEAIPVEGTTVHRLIGASPGGRPPRYGRDRRLTADIVVIDEASMLDLALMAQVLDALPDDARLILLGDRDQLASVEAGAVFGDVCAVADVEGSPLHGRLSTLTHSWRFREDGGIGKLAAAIRRGKVAEAMSAMRERDAEVGIEDGDDVRAPLRALLVEGYAAYVNSIVAGPVDEHGTLAALDAFDRFRVLCAVKDGPRGVVAVNRLAEDALANRLRIPRRSSWYAGRPVLVTRNDRSMRLVNGDVGVTVRVADEDRELSLRVAFRDGTGVRTVSTARLPEHETCWAMTVHKSQGSEFDRVGLVLPDLGPSGPSPVATRELVYTGVTRARSRVDLFATEAAFRTAVERPTVRTSGLREALARPRT